MNNGVLCFFLLQGLVHKNRRTVDPHFDSFTFLIIDGRIPLIQNQLGLDLAVFRQTGILYVVTHCLCN